MAADAAPDPVETARKLVVEVVEARGLVPKDGAGSSSPYVVIDFHGQRKRTRTLHRDLNPAWNETLVFNVRGAKPQGILQPPNAPGEYLEVDVLHDRRDVVPVGGGAGRRNHFLGRVRLDSRRFVRKGEEALMYFPLQKKSFFSWIRGDIGLKVYYADVPEPPVPPVDAGEAEAVTTDEQHAADAPAPPQSEAEAAPPGEEPTKVEPVAAAPVDVPPETPPQETDNQPPAPDQEPPVPEIASDTAKEPDVPPQDPSSCPPPIVAELAQPEPPVEEQPPPPPPAPQQPPQQQLLRTLPRAVKPPATPADPPLERSSYDLVEKVHYLFVRVVRARGLPAASTPHVRISAHGRHASTNQAKKAAFFFEWDSTFAFLRRDAAAPLDSPLEIAVWDLPPDAEIPDDKHFLGGVCFDTSEVPTRDPPDSPLATQWYKLEGGWARRGELMVATWVGTQADEAFHHAWKAEDGSSNSTAAAADSKSKVYVSPKLWYLRLTVIEAQDMLTFSVSNPAAPPTIRDSSPLSVKATLGGSSQTLRTRFVSSRNGSPSWNEDLIFVAGEPFGDQALYLSVDSRQSKDQGSGATPPFGTAVIPLSTIERRVDDRLVASRWLAIETPAPDKHGRRKTMTKGFVGVFGAGRLHVRVCLDGGYHVADELAHAASDYRPSARQLWTNPIGTVELGIIGCRGLLPMKTVQGKGATDAYAVAKYGPKWARTRTVTGTLDPAWNEQYTWEVYDPCTVITVGVFDDDAVDTQVEGQHQQQKGGVAVGPRAIGRVRIRISTLESRKPYRSMYPLLLLLPTGVKRMGDVELAVRFTRAVSSADVVHLYSRPMLPAMHYVHPLPPLQRDMLRSAAARIVASHLSRSEPSLRREVVVYMLENDPQPRFSMRKVRTNWNRIAASLSWAVDVWRFVETTRAWRNPTSTLLAHAVLVLVVFYPGMVVPAVALHVSGVGVWKYRGRPRGPAALSWGEGPAPTGGADSYYLYHGGGGAAGVVEELDEELDTLPSGKGYELLRARYDRLRGAAARVQNLLGDVAAQGERVQALVGWRDPRATGIFVVVCLLVSALLYLVPTKLVVVAAGFYYLRHPVFRDRLPPPALNFFRRLPSLSDRFL